MSFQPIIPLSGLTGWQFLQRTLPAQQEAFSNSVVVKRATETFREQIGQIRTAEQLVENRQLREVALGAFGLDDDIDAKAFIRQILDSPSSDPSALANRLTDNRYKAMAKTFGFGELGGPFTGLSTAMEDVITRYEARQFERAVGNQDNTMRLAMNARQSLEDVARDVDGTDARWFSIMGNAPLRQVIETAMGFSSRIGALDIDQQLEQFTDRAERLFGSSDPAEMLTDENHEKLIRLFLVRSEAAAISTTSGAQVALTLLQNIA
ncbi:MAG: Protein of unknown function (DUF1217) [Rhodobacteraceae bacterium HLUCCA08]|nr:MAG: Protein of unknown function (DUF1217) [Rhodobacteraceae bacterium HLUCCA08]